MTKNPAVGPTGRVDQQTLQARLASDPGRATSNHRAPGAITNTQLPVDGFPSPAPDSGEGFFSLGGLQ